VRFKVAALVLCVGLVLATAASAGKTIKKTYELSSGDSTPAYSLEIQMKGRKKSSLSPKAASNFTARGIEYTCADGQTGTINLEVKGPFKLTRLTETNPPDMTWSASGKDANDVVYTLDNAIVESSGKLASGDLTIGDLTKPSTATPPATTCETSNFLSYSVFK
jgi:hypothetical protein